MTVLVLHAAATWAMIGVILFVQIVHYPLFARVGEAGFAQYEQSHVRRTTIVVMPLMFTELITLALLLLQEDEGSVDWRLLISAALLAIVWSSTFLLQVPCHRKLERGVDAAVVRRLVRTNWIRTAAWTLRGVLVAWVIADHAGAVR